MCHHIGLLVRHRDFFVGVSKQSYYGLGGSGGQSGLGGFEGKSKKSPKEKCSSKT